MGKTSFSSKVTLHSPHLIRRKLKNEMDSIDFEKRYCIFCGMMIKLTEFSPQSES